MSVFPNSSRTTDVTKHPLFPYFFGFTGFCLLIGLILWFGMPAAPPPAQALPPDPFADPKAGMAHIEKLAQSYGNDFDKLSDNDKIMLNSIAKGHGRELLAKTVKHLKSRTGKNVPTPTP